MAVKWGGLSQKRFAKNQLKCSDLYRKSMFTNSTLMGVVWGQCPELHMKFMFGNTSPMEHGESVEKQFMKTIYDGNSVESPELQKTHVFYSSTSTWDLSPNH